MTADILFGNVSITPFFSVMITPVSITLYFKELDSSVELTDYNKAYIDNKGDDESGEIKHTPHPQRYLIPMVR